MRQAKRAPSLPSPSNSYQPVGPYPNLFQALATTRPTGLLHGQTSSEASTPLQNPGPLKTPLAPQHSLTLSSQSSNRPFAPRQRRHPYALPVAAVVQNHHSPWLTDPVGSTLDLQFDLSPRRPPLLELPG